MLKSESRYCGRHRGAADVAGRARAAGVAAMAMALSGAVLAAGSATAAPGAVLAAAGSASQGISITAPLRTGTDDLSLRFLASRHARGVVDVAPQDDAVVVAKDRADLTKLVSAIDVDVDARMTRPVPGRFSSHFGMRFHPTKHEWLLHAGVDMAAGCGETVVAALPGTVTFVGMNRGHGLHVVVDHGTVNSTAMTTAYSHLSSAGVTVGQGVGEGEGIARVGTTGTSTGCHLHFETGVDGELVNPAYLLSGKSAPPGVDVPVVKVAAATPTRTPARTKSTADPAPTSNPPAAVKLNSPKPAVPASPKPSPAPSPPASPAPTSAPDPAPSPTSEPTPTPAVAIPGPDATPSPAPAPSGEGG